MACRRQNLGHVDYKSRSCIRHLGRVDYKSGSCRVRIGVYVDYSLTWVAQTTTVDRHVLCRLQIWHTPSIAFQHSSLEEGCCKPVLGVCKYGSQTGNMSCVPCIPHCGSCTLQMWVMFRIQCYNTIQVYCQVSIQLHEECCVVPSTLMTHSLQSWNIIKLQL